MDSQQESKLVLFLKSEPLDEVSKEKLAKIHCKPVELQLMKFVYDVYAENLRVALMNIANYDALAFNSVNSIRSLSLYLKGDYSLIQAKRIFCVGKKTADLIRSEFNLDTEVIAKNQEELSGFFRTNSITNVKKCLYFIGTLSDLSKDFKDIPLLDISECLCYGTQELSINELEEQIKSKGIFSQKHPLYGIIYYSPSNTAFFYSVIEQLRQNENQEQLLNIIGEVKHHVAYGKKTLTELQKQLEKIKLTVKEGSVKVCENSCFEDVLKALES